MDAPVREPRQKRSQKSLEKVLVAGVGLLAEKGYDGFSIGDVSRRSGVSVGSIYQRFGSKDVLFAALQERILSEIDREQEQLFVSIGVESLSDAAIVDAAVFRVADTFQRNEALLKVMILRGAVDEETRIRGSYSSIALAQGFEGFLVASVRQFGHESPALACDVAFRIVYSALTRRIMSGPSFESARVLAWRDFVAELARACRAYLLDRTRSPAPDVLFGQPTKFD